MPHHRNTPTCALLAVMIAIAAFMACSPPHESDDAGHTEPDAPSILPTPVGMSQSLWTSLQAISPRGGANPPADATNAWADDDAAARLGQFLFFEEALSSNGEVSCATCHQADKGFADGLPLATDGVGGEENPTGRHTPGLLNVTYNDWYFWDGRADTLWGQATGPLEHPVEMAGTRVGLAHYVYDTSEVRTAYEALFGPLPASIDPFPERGRPVADPVTPQELQDQAAWESMTREGREAVDLIFANSMKAVAAYERRLNSWNSPFDQYVDQLREFPEEPEQWTAISAAAREGSRLFVEVVGCGECHNGPMLTDGKFHNLGLPEREWADSYDIGRWDGLPLAQASQWSSAGIYSDDPGGNQAQLLAALPQRTADKGAFRTPTLRNLGPTAPYMHAGQFADLREVLDFYNEQPDGVPLVGRRSGEVTNLKLKADQIEALVAFLESLDGEPVPAELQVKPSSPLLP